MQERQGYCDTEVHELLVRYRRSGDPRLTEELVTHLRPLVQAVARKFAGKEPIEDLEGEGYIGLMRAIERFAPDRGARFSTFATHLIAGQIRHYLRDRGHLIRQPAWLQEVLGRVDQATRELEQRLQRAPTGAEVAAAANLTEEGIEELLAARQTAQVVRIQGAVREDDEEFLEVDPEKFHSKEYVTLELPWEDKIALESALDRLKELEQKVLYSFFFQEFNQSEIARQLGISCNYVGYLLRNGLKHMRDGYPDDPTQAAATADPGSTGSVVDPETGLYTQEYLHRRLAEEMSRAQRSEHCVSVCVLQLPPRLPAPKLREAVRVLRSRMRRGDIPARSGARELAVIFLKTGSVADRVASRLADTLAEALGEPVTFGSATFPGDGRTAAAMLVTARRAPDERHPASPLGGSETDLPMVTHLALSSA